MSLQRREWLAMVTVFLVSLLMRVNYAWPALSGKIDFFMGDDDDYYALALSLVQHGTLGTPNPTAYRMPFFPLFLAFWHWLLGPSPYAALPVLLVISALTSVGVYLLGRQLFNPQVGLIAGCISIIDQDLIFYSATYLTETLFIFLTLAGMLALERTRQHQQSRWAITTGILFGLAALTRANFLPFVPVVLAWLVFSGRANLRGAFGKALIIAAIVGALWLPWVVRNYSLAGRLVPFTTQGGNAYYGTYNDFTSDPARGWQYGYWSNLPLPTSLIEDQDEFTLDATQRVAATEWQHNNPQKALLIRLMQIVHFWRPESLQDSFFWLAPLALVGLILAIRQRNLNIVSWVLFACVMTALSVLTIGVPRFHLPLHPFLTVLTAVVAALLWQRFAMHWRHAAEQKRSTSLPPTRSSPHTSQDKTR